MYKYQEDNTMLIKETKKIEETIATQLKEKEEACQRKENYCQEQEAEIGSLKKEFLKLNLESMETEVELSKLREENQLQKCQWKNSHVDDHNSKGKMEDSI